ncbi:SapC family protein [Marivita sp. XM-24bin2]|uniref:SapC family protein n=1 Tax=Marivita sp. XM-24bin2 TaxID=2133951 RepID=UPI000D793359|nr:SapC family protein [Marivita sp. XM-24bin2]PWL33439.1 MAG: hypothetical protein DCO97_19605 [Marivita sp. XM-24bin2]
MTGLSPGTHAHMGWRPAKGFGFARGTTLVPIAVAELPRVAQAMPVVFAKVEDQWQALGVMGPIMGTNVFVSRAGTWRASYVPALLRVYPFHFEGEETLALWSGYAPEPLVGEGVQPFYKDGDLAPWLQETRRFLRTVYDGVAQLHGPLETLAAAGALAPWAGPALEVPQPDRALSGLYRLEPERFAGCEDSVVLDLFRAGHLRWLYAHLDSLHHAERFKALAKDIVAPPLEAPKQPDKADRAADVLAAIAQDLGDTEL